MFDCEKANVIIVKRYTREYRRAYAAFAEFTANLFWVYVRLSTTAIFQRIDTYVNEEACL